MGRMGTAGYIISYSTKATREIEPATKQPMICAESQGAWTPPALAAYRINIVAAAMSTMPTKSILRIFSSFEELLAMTDGWLGICHQQRAKTTVDAGIKNQKHQRQPAADSAPPSSGPKAIEQATAASKTICSQVYLRGHHRLGRHT
jgi:hypothetical protein